MAARKKKPKDDSARGGSVGTFDIDYLKSSARGRWPSILMAVCGINPDSLSGEHGPCPKCGGTDRFRFSNLNDAGGFICGQCGKGGDGIEFVVWYLGVKFQAALKLIADHLGIESTPFRSNGKHSTAAKPSTPGGKPGEKIDPAKDLKFQPWSDFVAATFCLHKPGVTPAAILAVGGQIARYTSGRSTYTVVAIPAYGPSLAAAPPVGYSLYQWNGQPLPRRYKVGDVWKTEYLKVKLTRGSQKGIIADLARLAAAADNPSTRVWKLEGPSDLLAFLSLPDLLADAAPFTTANGASEKPSPWMLALPAVAGHQSITLHDADIPGERGAAGFLDESASPPKFTPGWANYLAATASESLKITLPYPLAETHGRDLRDWINEGHSYADLLNLPIAGPFERPAESLGEDPSDNSPAVDGDGDESASPVSQPPSVLEAGDDPHYLARTNLTRYATLANSATLRYWRSEWYTWKPSRGCYRRIEERELVAKVTSSVKDEFDRQWQEEFAHWKSGDMDAEGEPPPPPIVKKISKNLIANVLNALSALVLVPSSAETMTWLDAETSARSRRNYMAMENGVLDLDRLLEDRPGDTIADILRPHSPQWFSLTRLPYRFDPSEECPLWHKFLERNLEMDPERIKLLQEWAGYCLLPDTSHQKFLFLEGKGANGKSVFLAALSAMLGGENCSHIPLERFGERFEKTETLGKLVNICADVGEIDKSSEGLLKSFTSGEAMFFDRRYIGGITTRPTARLIIAGNNKPHFADKSDGIWRRLIHIPWEVQIGENERINGMDNPEYWERMGELPGIFLWAIRGLDRLRKQKKFTESEKANSAKEDYRDEMDHSREFLKENCEFNEHNAIKCDFLYLLYVKWMEQNGYRPQGSRQFGRTVRVIFPKVSREQRGSGGDREWVYAKISFSTNEICGEKTYDGNLF